MVSSRTSILTVMVSSAPDHMPLAERLVHHERAAVVASIALLTALAAGWTASGAGLGMDAMAPVRGTSLLLLVAMWWVMMAAMMLPSAAPAVLLYGRIRHQHGRAAGIASSWVFLTGYLLIWLGASVIATAIQLGAARAGLIDPMTMRASSPWTAGITLIAAGLYQLTPAKDACLFACRSPADYLSRHWRPGVSGALRLGMLHGGFCVGCCWLLMTLLFVGGVMNLVWIAALAALVAVEKLSRRGPLVGRVAGLILIAWGAARVAIELVAIR